LAYGDFVLDSSTRAFLLAQVETLSDPVSRGAAWVTLWEEMLAGRVAPPAFVDTALRALPRETVEQNIQLVTGYITRAFWRFLSDEERGQRAALLERTLRAGIDKAPSSSLKSTFFSAFYSTAFTSEAASFVERVWRRQQSIPGLTLAEPDEATMALELAVRGVKASAEILSAQRDRFQNPDRKARFEFVMPAVDASEAVRDQFFAKLHDVQNRRREPWVVEGLRYLNHPLRAAASRKHLRPSLDLLEEVQRTGDIFFPTNWMDAVLYGHRDAAAADIVRGFLAEHPDYPIRLRRTILQTADELFRASAR
jgi:aminopeptidase N